MKLHTKLGLSLSLLYLVVFLLSEIYTLYLLSYHTANSEFSGLGSILITLPWSVMIIPIVDSLGYISWYNNFANNPVVFALLSGLPLLVAATINATILYLTGSILSTIASKIRERI